jgi:hypothetical protein
MLISLNLFKIFTIEFSTFVVRVYNDFSASKALSCSSCIDCYIAASIAAPSLVSDIDSIKSDISLNLFTVSSTSALNALVNYSISELFSLHSSYRLFILIVISLFCTGFVDKSDSFLSMIVLAPYTTP